MRAYNGDTTLYFLQGINSLVEQYKGSSDTAFKTTAVYTLAPGAIGYIISKRSYANITTDYYYHYDAIGNVMFITDSNGNKVVDYVQEGFGNILATIGSLTSNNYHLTTKEIDPNTGLYYFVTRWYDPVIGRWITQEPTGIDGPNLYHYTFNNPINAFDPNGLFVFGKRPLKPLHSWSNVWLFENLFPSLFIYQDSDANNTEPVHEQGFFEDGSGENTGFFDCEGGKRLSEDPTGKNYVYDDTHYDDTLMREALKNLKDGKFNLFGLFGPKNNCQDWADRLRAEYERLQDLKD